MAEKVRVTPEQLRSAARDMGILRDRVGAILTNLETSLAAKGAAWGNDSYGSNFADGPEGYTLTHADIEKGMGDLRTTLDSYSDGQYKAATALANDHFGN
ncbi:WXG100 family type VII secretion target [Nocardia sp. CA-107356]|uniref:WXG100 family type VII secretion target n=1 Tax=Nocardia sp. CA-107356 TaxID=3239972 RepID=UPI003D89B443